MKRGEKNMLPKAKSKKLINEKEFAKVAKKVRKSLEEEEKYLNEKRLKYGDNISSLPYCLS
ncbi:hypothetical protein C4577_00635 [Candidatus Parcubacteria bacterium]|nr:MAG: hypothetical protein C4577_00635 [Candidatus Parcubacteria bacterium]